MEARLMTGSKYPAFEHVFTTPDGKPMDPSNDREAWVSLLQDAQVPYRKLHAASHTAETVYLADTVYIVSRNLN